MNRAELAATAAEVAGRVADVLQRNPLRPGRPYPLEPVLGVLAAQRSILQAALDACPEPVAVTSDGRPDRFGSTLSSLLSYLTHVLTMYHRLDDLPAALRPQATRDLAMVHSRARHLR